MAILTKDFVEFIECCAAREVDFFVVGGYAHGKIERFHRILIEEWVDIRAWTSEAERHTAHAGFIHYYNHHRSHGPLKWATPIATLNHHNGDNLPARSS